MIFLYTRGLIEGEPCLVVLVFSQEYQTRDCAWLIFLCLNFSDVKSRGFIEQAYPLTSI